MEEERRKKNEEEGERQLGTAGNSEEDESARVTASCLALSDRKKSKRSGLTGKEGP